MAIPHFDVPPPSETGHCSWSPAGRLLTPAGTLQGGAGLGAAIVAMQAATDRPAIWATAQYLSFAAGTVPIDIAVAIEVAGRKTTQARCVLSRDGEEILTAHAALGRRELDHEGVWVPRPAVPEPDDCEPFRFFQRGQGDLGDLMELRLVAGRQLDEIDRVGGRGDGSFTLWVRCWRGSRMVTPADLALIGDFVPVAFSDASGAGYSGNSLDNTIRVGRLVETEWVLLSIHVDQIVNGFGHGHAELWAEDGSLLGTVGQSAIVRTHERLVARWPAGHDRAG